MRTPTQTSGSRAPALLQSILENVASAQIDKTIAELGDWRGEILSRMRQLIKEVDQEVVEEVKWVKPSNPAGVPTWSHDGIICTGEIYKSAVKLT